MRVYNRIENGCAELRERMKLKTTVFDLCSGKYRNLTELARGMGISRSQIYRVRQGKRAINEQFITGAIKAFAGHEFADLFYVDPEGRQNDTLTTRDTAELLGVHPDTVRAWSNKGILKSYRVTRQSNRRFCREDVGHFVKQREIH